MSQDMTLAMQTSPITVSLSLQGSPLPNTRVDLLKENGTYVTYTTTNQEGTASFETLPEVLHKAEIRTFR